jgi:hypothetical protein
VAAGCDHYGVSLPTGPLQFPEGFGRFDRPTPPDPGPASAPDPSATATPTLPASEPLPASDPPAVADPGEAGPTPERETATPGPATPRPSGPTRRAPAPRRRPGRTSSRPGRSGIDRWFLPVSIAAAALFVLLSNGISYFLDDSGESTDSPTVDHLPKFGDLPGPEGDRADTGPAPLLASELYGDPTFDFRIVVSEDEILAGQLDLVAAIDHIDCVGAAAHSTVRAALADCEARIEALYYAAAYPGVRVSQQVLVFADPAAAEDFGRRLEDTFAGDVITFVDVGDLSAAGYAASRAGVEGRFVVVTLMVSESDEEAAVQAARDHSRARHAESLNYFIWR